MLRLYLFLPILAVAAETPWTCVQNTIIDLSKDKGVWIPSEDGPSLYKKNMTCSWKVLPYTDPGWFFSVSIKANFTALDSFSIRTSSGYQHDYMGTVRDIPQHFTGWLNFPSEELEILLTSKSDSYFGGLQMLFLKSGIPYYTHLSSNTIDLDMSQSVQQVLPLKNYGTIIRSSKEYVIRLVASTRDIRLANCLVYTGTKPGGQFVTGLDTQYDGVPRRFTTSMSVLCLGDRPTAYLLAATLPSSINPQSPWTVVIGTNDYGYVLASENTIPSYLTTYCDHCGLRSVQQISNKDASLQLYSGSLAPISDYRSSMFLQPLGEIPLSDVDSYTPQAMCATWNTFSITGGSVQLNFSDYYYNPQATYDWQLIRPGRKWFVATDKYGYRSDSSKVYKFFTTGDPLTYSFKIGNSDVVLDSVDVSVTMNSDADVVADYTMVWSTNPKTYTATGTGITMKTIPLITIGTIVRFEATKAAFERGILLMTTLLLSLNIF